MSLLPLALLLAAPTAQGSQEGGAAPAVVTVDRVEMIVNTDLITRRQLVRQLSKARQRESVTTREEETRLKLEIFRGALDDLLLRQAGEDLGQPKEAVDRVLDNVWKSQIEQSGGVREFSLKAEEEDESSIERREKLEGEIYTWTYSRIVTGNEPGRGGRLIADRYVRPGTRKRLYDYMERTGDGLRQIGGEPREVVLQQLVLPIPEESDAAARRSQAVRVHQRAEALRREALEGRDFNEIVDEHGALKGPSSLSGDFPLDVLRRAFPELADFAAAAEVGDISPVVPARRPDGSLDGWRVVRILETTPGKEPPFQDVEVQRRLERLAQYQLDERRRGEAVQQLLESAYVWSPDLDADKAARAAREAEAAAEKAALERADPREPAPAEPEPAPATDPDPGPNATPAPSPTPDPNAPPDPNATPAPNGAGGA